MGEMRLWGRVGAYACVVGGGPDHPFLLRELRWKFTGKRKTANQVNTLSSPGQRLATGRFFAHWNAEPMAERSFSGYATTSRDGAILPARPLSLASTPNRLNCRHHLGPEPDSCRHPSSGIVALPPAGGATGRSQQADCKRRLAQPSHRHHPVSEAWRRANAHQDRRSATLLPPWSKSFSGFAS